ncbi:general secretion pathway protein GspB [Pseudoalteromonas xiamenensis]|uniref:general secretion pathway protein GspB n=1 Tax=Pseudoalteromonas xiamenensis TaxID=882626 RepID=UPI0027E503F6|nr:general secretion pathway protein GspB [Pseudoalteromonas xiamenensis]WMN59124.1 general secretion pathway protein GspB [Pseudoalteromonas xiamenensis]
MSFVSQATKNMEQQGRAAHNPMNAMMEARLALYQARIRQGAWLFAALLCVGAGFATGTWVKPTIDVTRSNFSVEQADKAQNAMPSKEISPTRQPIINEDASAPEMTQQAKTPVVQKVVTDAAQNSTAQHFQWVSVQVGVDQFGQAIYQQQLVPVSQNGMVTVNNPQVLTVPTNRAKEVQTESQDLDELAKQGFRIVGKPLESSNTETAKMDFQGVSPELQAAFNDAVAATKDNPSQEVITGSNNSARVTPIDKLPSGFQASIPPIKYLTHIYSTEPSMRFIKINGRELYEGDNIGALRVVEITPDLTVFNFDGVEFSVEAMEDWPKSQ